MNPISQLRRAFAGLVALTAIAGCGTYDSASMRIDVDVYQGPLSVEPQIQWGELLGQMEEGRDRLDKLVMGVACSEDFGLFGIYECPWDKDLVDATSELKGGWGNAEQAGVSAITSAVANLCDRFSYLSLNEVGRTKKKEEKFKKIYPGYDPLNYPKEVARMELDGESALADPAIERVYRKNPDLVGIMQDSCLLRESLGGVLHRARGIDYAMRDALKDVRRLPADTTMNMVLDQEFDVRSAYTADLGDQTSLRVIKRNLGTVLQHAGEVAQRFRTVGKSYAGFHIGNAERKRIHRTAVVDLAAFTAEFGNSLRAKSDALMKQASGSDRRELPLSDQLRSASTSAFVDLYIWNRAAGPRYAGDPATTDYFQDRVNVLKGLYDDESWSRVNTAYASGQGKTAMAFIKDDIGNWNLKRFDNDPTDIIKAYSAIGKAALETVTTLAAGALGPALKKAEAAGKNVQAAKDVMRLADQVAFGPGGSAQAGPSRNPTVERLHSRTKKRLADLETELVSRAATLQADRDAAVAKLNAAQDKLVDAKKKREAAGREAPKGVEVGQTPADLKAAAAADRAKASLASTDKADAQTQINANNAKLVELNTQIAALRRDINDLDEVIRAQEQRQDDPVAESEDAAAPARPSPADLEARKEKREKLVAAESEKKKLDDDNAYLAMAVTNRQSRGEELTLSATAADDNAGKLADVLEAQAKIDREEITVHEAEIAKQKAERDRLQLLLDVGLFKEAVQRSREIIGQHASFVDELETLSIEETAAAEAAKPLNRASK